MRTNRVVIVVAVSVATVVLGTSGRAALALGLPAGTQVFSPPASIASDCSADVTKPLYDWINTLPQGTPTQPTEVQFASGGCYQVDGMIFLRGLTDFVFDGNGSKFSQSSLVNGELFGDPPRDRPAYCGSSRFADAEGTIPSALAIMWFVEGGCDLVFENMDIVGTNQVGTGGTPQQQDSAFQLGGAQRVMITNCTIQAVWGDFVTVAGLHEASYGGLFWPSQDVTISNNNMEVSGRQGVTVVYGDRVLVSGNRMVNIPDTAIDMESDVNGGTEGDISVTNNTIEGYGYLVAALTGAHLSNFAFTNNTVSQTRIVLDDGTTMPGHDITISSNDAIFPVSWSKPYDINLGNVTNVLVSSNTVPMQPVSRTFVNAGKATSNITVANNTLNPTAEAPANWYPFPVGPATNTTAYGCGNATSNGSNLDANSNPPPGGGCSPTQPAQPAPAAPPVYVS